MQQIFSKQENKLLHLEDDKQEVILKNFLWDNREVLFPAYTFIAKEFHLKGESSKFIDMLAYYTDSSTGKSRFVIFELKQGYDEFILDQAIKYRKAILGNPEKVYLHAKVKCPERFPSYTQFDLKNIDIVLIAKEFGNEQIKEAKDKQNGIITLVKYNWFENDYFFLDYVYGGTFTVKPKTLKLTNDTEPDIDKALKWMDRMIAKGWEDNLASTREKSIRIQLQRIPYTKENLNQLKNIVAEASDKGRRAILEKFLELLEARDFSNTEDDI